MLREDFNNGIQALHHYGLTYDFLIYEPEVQSEVSGGREDLAFVDLR